MIDLFEELFKEYLPTDTEILNEKWYTHATNNSLVHIWYSDSASKFKGFLENTAGTDIKGLRLCIAPDKYLAARASELSHSELLKIAAELNLIDKSAKLGEYEPSTCGFPTYKAFDSDNYEMQLISNTDSDNTSYLCANCEKFEVLLYNFKSNQFPEHESAKNSSAILLETSETWKVLQPMIKKLYITGQEQPSQSN